MQQKIQITIVALMLLAFTGADGKDEPVAGKRELARLQDYVGQWRGVGQPRRGSSRGAWTQQCEWAWKFSQGRASLNFTSASGRYFKGGSLQPTAAECRYQLTTRPVAGPDTPVKYSGTLDDGKLVLVAENPLAEYPARISIRLVARGDRMLVLYERKSSTSQRFLRLAEVGYTRRGSDFGKGTSYVECVVTGGKGTIPVTFEGKTYYVCCTGCRDYFNEDPQAVLDEYRERKP